jgi:competence protein ComEC
VIAPGCTGIKSARGHTPKIHFIIGGVAQLVRVLRSHRRGQEFESPLPHHFCQWSWHTKPGLSCFQRALYSSKGVERAMRRFSEYKRAVLVLLLLLLTFLLTSQAIAGVLSIHFIDVGQGDAILIQSPLGKTMLVDGGDSKNECVRKLLDYLRKADISNLDIIVATHPHVDHIGGLISVLEQFEVGRVYDSGKIHETSVFYEYLSLIDEKDIPFGILRRGDRIALDSEVEIMVLHPVGEVGLPNLSVNDCSVVLKIIFGEVEVLLTGDIGVAIEEKLVREGLSIDSDVLKVSHHGSRYASSSEFLDAVAPSFAILSVGIDNSYGHPHDEILKSLREREITTFLTSIDGTIVIETDGKGITISTDRGKYSNASKSDKDAKLNINKATQTELESLPGIGQTLGRRIIEYRETHGGFKSIAEIMQVSGIGAGKFEQLEDLITVE